MCIGVVMGTIGSDTKNEFGLSRSRRPPKKLSMRFSILRLYSRVSRWSERGYGISILNTKITSALEKKLKRV